MDRSEKEAFVSDFGATLGAAAVVVVARFSGLSVMEITDFRRRMRESGGSVRVAKNRLVKLAIRESDLAHMSDLLSGPTLLVYSSDPVVAPKNAVDFAKSHSGFEILGGALGSTELDANAVKTLAELPSLDELRGRLVGVISAPATKLVRLFNTPGAQLARVLNAYSEKNA